MLGFKALILGTSFRQECLGNLEVFRGRNLDVIGGTGDDLYYLTTLFNLLRIISSYVIFPSCGHMGTKNKIVIKF